MLKNTQQLRRIAPGVMDIFHGKAGSEIVKAISAERRAFIVAQQDAEDSDKLQESMGIYIYVVLLEFLAATAGRT